MSTSHKDGRSVAAPDVALSHTVAGSHMDTGFIKHVPKAAHGRDRAPPKTGAYPAPATGAHGYGHSDRKGHERNSGDGRAHRIGKR
jgi:hypothetical protein